MTQNLAIENAEYGVRVNAILPGLMDTPMAIEHWFESGVWTEKPSVGNGTHECHSDGKWETDGTSPPLPYSSRPMRQITLQVFFCP